jgi:hypothetical protein
MELVLRRTFGKKRADITNDDYECRFCHLTHKELIFLFEQDHGVSPRTVTEEEVNRVKAAIRGRDEYWTPASEKEEMERIFKEAAKD